MLADGLQKEKVQIVRLQECRSKERGIATNCDDQRVIPDVTGPAVRDVELWFNTVTFWDAEDPPTVLAAGDAQIVATGPKFMIVHIGNAWIDMDIVVVHAPYAWDTKHEEGAEEITYACCESLKEKLKKRAKLHAPLFLLGDVNIEFSHGQLCYEGIGPHQPAKEATHPCRHLLRIL